MNIACPA